MFKIDIENPGDYYPLFNNKRMIRELLIYDNFNFGFVLKQDLLRPRITI